MEGHSYHSYYEIGREELGKDAKIPIVVCKEPGEAFYELALEMVEEIEKNNAAGLRTVFICPVGPVGHYPIFVRLVNERKVSLKDCWFFNMDEYLTDEGEWVPKEDRLSFRGFMERTVYSKIAPELNIPEEQRIFPDPHHPEKGDELLEKLGGADICFGGIGITGHLAFNEPQPELSPEEFAALPTRVRTIAPETRAVNSIGDLRGALEDMPSLCVTIGMKQILSAKKVRLGMFRDWHYSVIRRAAYGEVSASFPVTLLQRHPDAKMYMSERVASGN